MNTYLFASIENMWLLTGWTMIHFLWLGTLVGLAAVVSRWLLCRTSASVRYVVALTGLAMLAAMPIAIAMWLHEYSPSVQFADQPLRNDAASRVIALKDTEPTPLTTPPAIAKGAMPMAVQPAQQAAPPSETAIAAPTPAIAAPLPGDPLSLAVSTINRSVQYLPWLWLIGTPLTFAFTATGLIGTRRLRRASRPISDGPIAEALTQLATSLRLSRRVVVAVCDRIAGPVLIGILRPIILLPPAALTGYSPDEIEMVLLHELAHVRRWDNLVNLIQRVVESLLFFHPAAWLISSWVRRERETCCDALVVARTDHPHAYAELLVALAAQMPRSVLFHPAASSAMAAGPLRSRIRRILKLDDDPMLVSGKSFTLLLAGLITVATLTILYLPTTGEAKPSDATAAENKDKRDSNSGEDADKEERARFEHFEKSLKSVEIVIAMFNDATGYGSQLEAVHKALVKEHRSLFTWGLKVDPKSSDGKRYQLIDAPVCIVYRNGKETSRLSPVQSAEQLQTFVKNAVGARQVTEMPDGEKTERLESRDKLQKELQELQSDIKRKYDDYLDFARGKDHPITTGPRDPEIDLLIRDIAEVQKKVQDLTAGYYQLQTDYMIAKRELSDPKLLEVQAAEALKQDSHYADLLEKANAQTAPSDGSEYLAVEKYRADFKKKMIREMQNKPNVPLQQLTQRFRTNADSIQKQIALLTQSLEQKKKELERRADKSIDFGTRGEELKKLQQSANEMNVKLERLNIDGDELEPLVFELKSNGSGQTEILLNGNRATEDSIRKLLRERVASNTDQAISLKADKSISYAEVMRTIDFLESLGIKKLALDTRSHEATDPMVAIAPDDKSTASIAANFRFQVRFEKGAAKFLEGDAISIDEVRGTAKTFEPGNQYWIKGTYKLHSHDQAQISAFTTARDAADGTGPIQSVQTKQVSGGDEPFTLILPMSCRGWPHISFYPAGNGGDFGGVYFGTGDSVLKEWWGSEKSQSAAGELEVRKQQVKTISNLKNLGIALLNYHDAKHQLPANAVYSADGKPLLSWRVAILPSVDPKLYGEFHLDESWDSEHNRKLIARMPEVFKDPKLDKEGVTNYLAVVGKECAFDGSPKGLSIKNITDGTSNTIAVVEANTDLATEWTRPQDWNFDREQPTRGLGQLWRGGWYGACVDGSVSRVENSKPADQVGIQFTRAGGESKSLQESANRAATGFTGSEGTSAEMGPSALGEVSGGVTKSSKFPSLEDQKLADLAYKRLSLELEPIGGADLKRVKALGYEGGVKVASGSAGLSGLEDSMIRPDDILVGLHAWPTTNMKEVGDVLERGDLKELNPLKFYIVRNEQSGPPTKENPNGSTLHDGVHSGRVNVNLGGGGFGGSTQSAAAVASNPNNLNLQSVKSASDPKVEYLAAQVEQASLLKMKALDKRQQAQGDQELEAANRQLERADRQLEDAKRALEKSQRAAEENSQTASNKLEAALKAKQDALIKRQQAKGQEAIEAAKDELGKANRQLEDVKRSLEKEIYAAETGNSNAQPILHIKPRTSVAVESPSGSTSASASPEELEILRERAKIAEDQFQKNDEQYKTGGRGGSKDRREVAAYELALAQANLAMAEGKRDDALAKLIECQALAEEAYKAVVSSYDAGRVSYDFLRTESNRLSEIKLKVARLKRENKSPTQSTPSPAGSLNFAPAPEIVQPLQPKPVAAASTLAKPASEQSKATFASSTDNDDWLPVDNQPVSGAPTTNKVETPPLRSVLVSPAKSPFDSLGRPSSTSKPPGIRQSASPYAVEPVPTIGAQSNTPTLAASFPATPSEKSAASTPPPTPTDSISKPRNTSVPQSSKGDNANDDWLPVPEKQSKTGPLGAVAVPNVEQVKIADRYVAPSAPTYSTPAPVGSNQIIPGERRSGATIVPAEAVFVAYDIPPELRDRALQYFGRSDVRSMSDDNGRHVVQATKNWHDHFAALLKATPKWGEPAAAKERTAAPIVMKKVGNEDILEWRSVGLSLKPTGETGSSAPISQRGVEVAEVVPGSPAAWADIHPGDVLETVGSFNAGTMAEVQSLLKALGEGLRAKKAVQVRFSREYLRGRRDVAAVFTLGPVDLGAKPAEPQNSKPSADTKASPAPADKANFSYEGKPFGYWRSAWQTELSTDKRIEAVQALAAFGANGYGREAAQSIFDVADQYEWVRGTRPDGVMERAPLGKLQQAVFAALAGTPGGARIAAAFWLPLLKQRYETDPAKWQSLALLLLQSASSGKLNDDEKSLLFALAKGSDESVSSQAYDILVRQFSDNEELTKMLTTLFHDKSHWISAVRWLGRTQQYPPEVIELFLHGDQKQQADARRTFLDIPSTPAKKALVATIVAILKDDSKSADHIAAIRTLAELGVDGSFGQSEAPQLLEAIAKNGPLEKQVAAAFALQHSTRGKTQAASLLDEHFRDAEGKSLDRSKLRLLLNKESDAFNGR